MVVYGWNSKNIKQAPLATYECPSCKEKNSQIAILSYYFHVFWIPLFPYKKTAHVVCSTCSFSQEGKELSGEMKENVKMLKHSVKTPKYIFSGTILLILVVSYLLYIGNKNSQLEQNYINNPEIGDVYVLKDFEETTIYNHYLLKVVDIVDDSLHVTFNSFTYDGVVSKLDPKDGFYDIWYSMHKKEVKDYDISGELKKVIRDYSSRAGFDKLIEYQFQEDSISIE